jgi:hypothetical protein
MRASIRETPPAPTPAIRRGPRPAMLEIPPGLQPPLPPAVQNAPPECSLCGRVPLVSVVDQDGVRTCRRCLSGAVAG